MSDKFEEEAKKILKDNFIKGETDGLYTSFSIMTEVLSKSIRAAYAKGMERAAEIAEKTTITNPEVSGDMVWDQIAEAIRQETKAFNQGV